MAAIDDAFSLSGKRAVVTGASRGLGAAMAVALAEAGADLILVARSDSSGTREQVERTGRSCQTLMVDLGDRAATNRLADAFDGDLEAPDILINNAGTIRRAPFTEFSDADWDEVMETNLSSLFVLSRGFARALIARGRPGKIIHVASMLSFQGGIRVASYTAAKSGLAGLTRLMANELAAQRINVNAIAPGYMATDNTAALRADSVRNQAILDRIPAGRWGTPSDLCGAALFLASPAADYVHGHILAVDGGWLAR